MENQNNNILTPERFFQYFDFHGNLKLAVIFSDGSRVNLIPVDLCNDPYDIELLLDIGLAIYYTRAQMIQSIFENQLDNGVIPHLSENEIQFINDRHLITQRLMI